MTLFYSAVFSKLHDNSYMVNFPDLHHEAVLNADDQETLKAAAVDELGFALWMFEEQGKRIPLPKSVAHKKQIDSTSYVDVIPIDYNKFKQHVQVKTIDLS